MQITLGFLTGALTALAAWRAGALSTSGALAATLTGGLIFALGGIPWAIALLTFFISSSILSKIFAARKARLSEKFSKGSRRDWGQVLANGGVGSLLVLIHTAFPGHPVIWAAYLGALATVTADTWGTELGVLNPHPPQLITTGKTVEAGTSGGISRLGMLAALGGALLIGLIGAVFSFGADSLSLLLAATLGGISGSLLDSLLGATIQAIYHCPSCHKETERHPLHTCGSETQHIRGWRWLNNDWVNFLSSTAGAAISVSLFLYLK